MDVDFGSASMRSKVQEAIAHAQALDRKAEKSGDPKDFVAASTAYGNAAYQAHNIGVDPERPKDERARAFKLGVELNKMSDACKKRSEELIRAARAVKREMWSERYTLTASGAPPAKMVVLDDHGGFTAVTRPGRNKTPSAKLAEDPKAWLRGETLWRPGSLLKHTTEGYLVAYDNKSFFQNNNDVTQALYKVARGYRYPIAVWFDNKTGNRIA